MGRHEHSLPDELSLQPQLLWQSGPSASHGESARTAPSLRRLSHQAPNTPGHPHLCQTPSPSSSARAHPNSPYGQLHVHVQNPHVHQLPSPHSHLLIPTQQKPCRPRSPSAPTLGSDLGGHPCNPDQHAHPTQDQLPPNARRVQGGAAPTHIAYSAPRARLSTAPPASTRSPPHLPGPGAHHLVGLSQGQLGARPEQHPYPHHPAAGRRDAPPSSTHVAVCPGGLPMATRALMHATLVAPSAHTTVSAGTPSLGDSLGITTSPCGAPKLRLRH